MPRLGRFLFGAWPKPSKIDTINIDNKEYYSSRYHDYKGAIHKRSFSVSERSVDVIDDISNFKHKAILRWHIDDEGLTIKDIESGILILTRCFELVIKGTSEIIRYDIKKIHKSLYYLSETDSTVLEVEFNKKSKIYSSFKFIN